MANAVEIMKKAMELTSLVSHKTHLDSYDDIDICKKALNYCKEALNVVDNEAFEQVRTLINTTQSHSKSYDECMREDMIQQLKNGCQGNGCAGSLCDKTHKGTSQCYMVILEQLQS